MNEYKVTILGAGLAGCEAALWLAGKGVQIELYEQKPVHFSPAHKSEGFAELICSNSLKAERLDSASGLLKEEMRRMGSRLLTAAEETRVAAGGALAVDRDAFSAAVTRMVEQCENITVHREQVETIDESAPILVATGPLTDGALADEIGRLTGDERLHFYDAVAPIVTAESLDYGKVFAASRYDRGEADYLNCPFNKAEYEAFHAALAAAERAPLHDFDTGAEQSTKPDPDAHELVSSYQCSPLTVDEEFMLTKRLYEQTTGRRQKSDVIAYQVRQSFRPGEVTPEEANRIGYEFAERFLKGKHAFIVATHTDRAHIHNHIIYNSTALDGTRKFRDFFFSALAVQRLSDLICLEHQLSVIQKKPYRERQKRILYPPKESNRDKLCAVIDNILLHDKPKDFAAFLDSLEQQGYEVKRGKHPSVKGKGQRRFIRFRTLGAGYTEEEIRAVLDGKAEHQPHPKQPLPEKKFGLLMDIPAKMAEGKTSGYKKWATKFNLKEMSKTLLYLQEKKIDSADELRERAAAATERYHTLGDSIKAAEKRMGEIAVLRAHIVNYAKTRDAYAAYRKAGYSKKFLEAHREEIELHKAAKAAFDEADLKKLPKVKDLNVEYSELLSQKKAAYPEYRKAKEEMQELVRAQKNVERFFAEEKQTHGTEQVR
mgnify:CR=1 FL=1